MICSSRFSLFLLLLPLIATSSTDDSEDFYEDFDEIDVDFERRKIDEIGNEPPVTASQITNLFYGKMLALLRTNEAQYVDTIAKYTDSETQLLSCHVPGERLNFARFNQIARHLFLYFVTIEAGGTSFAPGSEFVKFEVKYKAISQDDKHIELTWRAEANFDSTLKYFVLSKIDMVGDCSQIPKEFPTDPTESLADFQTRLRTALFNDVFLANHVHQKASYQSFNDEFLISRARVQFCEKNGQVKDRTFFTDYLFTRYGAITKYTELEMRSEQFSSYQTDVLFSVTVNGDSRDMYRFRVSAQSEVIHGWPHWWVDYVEVMCPKHLNPSTSPREQQDEFVGHVCGSISAMINNGQSVESRSTFLSHMNGRPDSGFWAIVCGRGGPPVTYGELDDWLDTWSSGYKNSRLENRQIVDYAHFEFACKMALTKDNGAQVRREFKMKAFFETDQWLVKEVRISCDS